MSTITVLEDERPRTHFRILHHRAAISGSRRIRGDYYAERHLRQTLLMLLAGKAVCRLLGCIGMLLPTHRRSFVYCVKKRAEHRRPQAFRRSGSTRFAEFIIVGSVSPEKPFHAGLESLLTASLGIFAGDHVLYRILQARTPVNCCQAR